MKDTMQYAKEIKELFEIGNSPLVIAKKLNLQPTLVNEIINRYKIQLLQISTIDGDQVIEFYNKGSSTNNIGKIFGVSKGKIQRILNSKNIKIRSSGEREYNTSINENYFSLIDDYKKSYWLGFLLEKVIVSSNGKFELIMNTDEKYLMESFLKNIEYSNLDFIQIIDNNEKYKYCKIIFYNEKFTSDFIYWTNNLHLISNFNSCLLGMMDSRGNIDSHGRLNEYRFNLYLGKDKIDKVIEYLNSNTISYTRIDGANKKNKTDEIQITGNEQLKILLDSIYLNSEFGSRLEEYYNRYKLLCSKQNSKLK